MTAFAPPPAGTTGWITLTQEMFTRFETLTLSNDPLHTDAQFARRHGGFEGTIAPGLLVLSLLPYFASQLVKDVPGHHALNYGFERVRWPQPVPVGSRVRAHFTFAGDTPLGSGRAGSLRRIDVRVEIEGEEKPALVAEWLGALMPDSAA